MDAAINRVCRSGRLFKRRQYPSTVKGHKTIKLEGPFDSKTRLGICRICHLLSTTWCPWFELKIRPLRQTIADYTLDHQFSPEEFNEECVKVFEDIRDHIMVKPILQRANIRKRFYLKTDFSSLGLGFALCQPDDADESIAAMKRENEGGECKFEFCLSKLRSKPIAFGSRKTAGNEKHFHSHPGKALAARWSIVKNRHFLWGRPFTLMTDCRALIWLMS
jgi:hypothetical protein